MDLNRLEEALTIVESTNWNKCNNVNTIVLAAKVYEAEAKYEEAKELLYLAHERSPIGRMIIYHLALNCIELGELEEAKDYYEEFVEIAPHDSLKYIIKYKLSKAAGAENTTLIAILEELKGHDFLEEWSYELAYLYHKTLQIDKCIDLCDEIILWFGDGPYVERALEMKMIYQPLDKAQEDKYRSFQNKRQGITEIKANELLSSGEIVSKNIEIPSVEIQAEKFNTINLQAEIKKNIDEIMRATEAGEVNENMENIKTLVEEIPYLQVTDDRQKPQKSKEEANQKTLMDTFKGYLAEEYDGQISLLVPEPKEEEEQIEGQMTIEDVMAEWEKTKRAAEATLQDAQKQELDEVKGHALEEAAHIMDRLEGAMPKLEAGASPTDLLKEEYMSKPVAAVESAASVNMDEYIPSIEEIENDKKEAEVFNIPKVTDGHEAGVGLTVPVIHPAPEMNLADKAEIPSVQKGIDLAKTQRWEPPRIEKEEVVEVDEAIENKEAVEEDEAIENKEVVEEDEVAENKEAVEEDDQVNIEEASKIVADVNDMLQQEIDRIMAEDSADQEEEQEIDIEDSEVAQESDVDEEEVEQEADTEEPAVEEDILPQIIDPEELLKEESSEEDESQDIEEADEEDILPEIEEIKLEPEEVAELVDEKVLERAISDEMPQVELTEDEKEIFSYFMPIAGMENTICQALTGSKSHISNRKNSATGNIIIQGSKGSGKTMLASNLIKVIQNETGKQTGPAGKIDAEQLNKKDIPTVLSKVEGGSLIIEDASVLTEATIETLRQQMSLNTTHVLVVLEAEKGDIEKLMAKNNRFSAMFTEKITIPIFTIDELVNFGKVYALENGYAVDEVAILAMYNRINLVHHLGRPTALIDVRDIMEDAIENAERGGIKAAFGRLGAKKYDEDGNLILREKDFELN